MNALLRFGVEGLPGGADVAACEALVAALGARLERRGTDALLVHGLSGALAPGGALGAGESGTLARLATALVAWSTPARAAVRIDATGSLLARSSAPLFATLAQSGVSVRHAGRPDGWPVELVPLSRPPRRAELVHARSSQELSALLLACAAHAGEHELAVRGPLPSRPYVGLTSAVLQRFGAQSTERAGGVWSVRGPLVAPAEPLGVEADASAAAVVLAAACLSGGSVRVEGLGASSAQGDVRIVEHLRAFGCDARSEREHLSAEGRPVRPAELDLAGEPDLAPVLAAVAAAAADASGRESRLGGLGTLRGKESDRIEVLARGLSLAGWDVRAAADELRVGPRATSAARDVLLDPAGDHRMAFAFALLGLVRDGLRVQDPRCVAKSWPGFWDDLAGLGARCHEAP